VDIRTEQYGRSSSTPGKSRGNISCCNQKTAKPGVPAAPTTSVATNVSVTISWVASYANGSTISVYGVAIRQTGCILSL